MHIGTGGSMLAPSQDALAGLAVLESLTTRRHAAYASGSGAATPVAAALPLAVPSGSSESRSAGGDTGVMASIRLIDNLIDECHRCKTHLWSSL